MSSPKRNRLQLLRLRKKLSFVKQGIKILTDKRDELMKEFYLSIKDVSKARKLLDESMRVAAKSLLVAKGMEPHESIASAAFASQKKVMFSTNKKKVWGVEILEIIYKHEKRAVFEYGSLPGYRSPTVDKTAEFFEEALGMLIENAVLENRLMKIGSAIKATSRRVNALEQQLEPKIKSEIKTIRSYMEEWGREEIFRMKRFKAIQGGESL